MGREWGGALRTENVSCMHFSSWFCHTLGDVVNGEKLSFILSKKQ